jgi:hypothetical protein
MLGFQDIFVSQILGELINRKYVGMISFTFEDDQKPISIWLDAHGITHVQHKNEIGKEPLYAVYWRSKGKFGLYPKVVSPALPPMDFTDVAEHAITKMLPPLPMSCPMLDNAYVRRNKQPEKLGWFADNCRNMQHRIPAEGIELTHLRSHCAGLAFWPTLLYLCSDGRISCSYELTLGRIFKDFEEHLITKLTSLFGARTVVPFTHAVSEVLQNTWPDWTSGTLPDSLYGAAPYYLWEQTLKMKISMVGIPKLANRCFEQALDKLAATDADLIRHLHNF